jgi:hypothetical protein
VCARFAVMDVENHYGYNHGETYEDHSEEQVLAQ